MATGLQGGRTNSEPEWVLEFCGFKYPQNDSRDPGAWSIAPKPGGKSQGEGVTIVHPDTGYTDHPELMKGQHYVTDPQYARNFVNPLLQGNRAKDPLWAAPGSFPSHGTSTASVIVSAEGHPNVPTVRFFGYPEPPTNFVSGVAPMADVIPCRVGESVALVHYGNLANAIYHALSLEFKPGGGSPWGVGVISISLGGVKSVGMKANIEKALRAARDAGIVICAAAGQLAWNNTERPTFPGNDPNTIGVAACDYQHTPYAVGLYGPEVDITAPGVNVWHAKSYMMTDAIERYSVRSDGCGTSYATAIVAGACALWQAHHGRANLIRDYGLPLIFDLFKKVLKDSCHKPQNWDSTKYGAGVLDAVALLNFPLPPKAEIEQLRANG